MCVHTVATWRAFSIPAAAADACQRLPGLGRCTCGAAIQTSQPLGDCFVFARLFRHCRPLGPASPVVAAVRRSSRPSCQPPVLEAARRFRCCRRCGHRRCHCLCARVRCHCLRCYCRHPLPRDVAASPPHALAMNGHLRRGGVRSASVAVASGRTGSRSYHSRRTSTPVARGTRTETATAATAEEPSYIAALIENRAREVGLALYSLRSFHVELRQYCDSNSFSTTLAALAVAAYVVTYLGWHPVRRKLHFSLSFVVLCGCMGVAAWVGVVLVAWVHTL